MTLMPNQSVSSCRMPRARERIRGTATAQATAAGTCGLCCLHSTRCRSPEFGTEGVHSSAASVMVLCFNDQRTLRFRKGADMCRALAPCRLTQLPPSITATIAALTAA